MLELYSDLIEPNEPQTDQETAQTVQETDQETVFTVSNDNEDDQEMLNGDQEKTVSDLISDQKTRILNLIKLNSKITRSEISKAMGLHDSSVKRRLESLISEGLIRRVGATKAGHWEIL